MNVLQAVPVAEMKDLIKKKVYRSITSEISSNEPAYWKDGSLKGNVLQLLARDQRGRDYRIVQRDNLNYEIFIHRSHFKGDRPRDYSKTAPVPAS